MESKVLDDLVVNGDLLVTYFADKVSMLHSILAAMFVLSSISSGSVCTSSLFWEAFSPLTPTDIDRNLMAVRSTTYSVGPAPLS